MDTLTSSPRHDTVLLTEAVDALDIQADDVVVDATLGGAGHFSQLLSRLGPDGCLVGIDADQEAIERAHEALAAADAATLPQVKILQGNFRHMAELVAAEGIESVDKVLFDLGWSGFQLAAGRGFSFRASEPLLMTYDTVNEGATTAADFVNLLSETALADLIFSLGEERFARGIAKSIVAAREEKPLETTFDLVAAIEAGVPAWYLHRRLHPATKTFQALRIAVNDELNALRDGLTAALSLLTPGGRIAVISFHSIEDRIVKTMLRDAAHAGQGTLVTRKPLSPSLAECRANPRARSAKLRVFERAAPDLAPITHSNLRAIYA